MALKSIKSHFTRIPPQDWKESGSVFKRLWQNKKQLKSIRDDFRNSIQDGKWSKDWFTRHIPTWISVINMPRDAALNILEIGSYEGLCTRFLLWYFPNAKITCIDTFEGSAEDGENSPRTELEQRFENNVSPYMNRVQKIKGDSRVQVPKLHNVEFDLIYVDGYHHSHFVMTDALNAWPYLKKGGIMIFDDYEWVFEAYPEHHKPRAAIDLFLQLIKGEYNVMQVGYQKMLKRK